MQRLSIVTTSWDDGDPNDLRIAELLYSKRLPGTFYVPFVGYNQKKTLGTPDLRALYSLGFEIGAHTVSHASLVGLLPSELHHEIGGCKEILEQTLGCEVPMFCYPNGRYNADVLRHVKNAGYRGARTTRMLSFKTSFSPFEMPTTVQAYPHCKTAYFRNLGRAASLSGLVRYTAQLSHLKTWVELGKELFGQVLRRGGIWHLYGHSWEIEKLDLWDDLREMLDYVSDRQDVTYATNAQLLSLGGSRTNHHHGEGVQV